MDILYGILGLIILVLAGDALVHGAVSLALRLGIPALIVSLTIVSFGTSAPELFISIGAVMDGAPGIAIGNVVGSNTANVLLVLGIPALISGIDTHLSDTRRSYIMMIFASLWFIALCFFGPLTWVHGVLMLGALAVILSEQVRESRGQMRASAIADAIAEAEADAAGTDVDVEVDIEGADPQMPLWRIATYLILGLVGLPVGATLLVDAAVNIATSMGVSETVIGLTLVAIGTSLPELATTVMAALRRHAEVALGNVIGSNLFNLLAIIGISSFFGEIPIGQSFLGFDLWVMLAASLVLGPFVLLRRNMTRAMGAILTALYVAYVVVVLV